MGKFRALSPGEARASLAQRLGKTADRVRNVATKLGARPYRVFLVHEVYPGEVRGEGGPPRATCEQEILPVPKVESLDSVTFSIFHAGTIPVGSVRVSEVSIDCYTYDQLRGMVVPGKLAEAGAQPGHVGQLPSNMDFFYEIVEDGRGDCPPVRQKYRLLNQPMRQATKVMWTLMLERVSEDRGRDGKSKYLSGTQG